MPSLVDITGKNCDGSGSDYWSAGSALLAYATRWPDACGPLPAGYVRFSPGIDCDGTTVEIFKVVDNLVSGQPATVGPNTITYNYSYNCGNAGGPFYLPDGVKYFRQDFFSTSTDSLIVYDPLEAEPSCDPADWPTIALSGSTSSAVRPLLRYVGSTLACSAFRCGQFAYNGFNLESVPVLLLADGSSLEVATLVASDGFSNRTYGSDVAVTLQNGVYLCPIGERNSNDGFTTIQVAIGTPVFWTDFEGCKEVSE